MLSDLKTALQMLQQAMVAIEEGTKKHGDTEPSFHMIADLWTTYCAHLAMTRPTETLNFKPHDVAAMMSLLKIARAAYSYSFDNYVDEAGYTALAAMLHPQTTHAGKPNESV